MTIEMSLSMTYAGFELLPARGLDWVGAMPDTSRGEELRANLAEVPVGDVELEEFRVEVSAARLLFAQVMEELAG